MKISCVLIFCLVIFKNYSSFVKSILGSAVVEYLSDSFATINGVMTLVTTTANKTCEAAAVT